MNLIESLVRTAMGLVSRPSIYPLEERLDLDVRGPAIHADYYRRDCADALAEIRRMKKLAMPFGEPS